ncbi:hypothetical protein GGX14DRAFT_580989 [Mycena pura]|uniref:Uncharacterized protein n=1 Tax=Mycena pura TaxID=153505 RepID=A0AAD6ULL8_9AGAR|nr:hypothetical protein GGX14DRAFT_580989 [Mycena pura]
MTMKERPTSGHSRLVSVRNSYGAHEQWFLTVSPADGSLALAVPSPLFPSDVTLVQPHGHGSSAPHLGWRNTKGPSPITELAMNKRANGDVAQDSGDQNQPEDELTQNEHANAEDTGSTSGKEISALEKILYNQRMEIAARKEAKRQELDVDNSDDDDDPPESELSGSDFSDMEKKHIADARKQGREEVDDDDDDDGDLSLHDDDLQHNEERVQEKGKGKVVFVEDGEYEGELDSVRP